MVALDQGRRVGLVRDFAPSMGAALSYYTVFSLAPLMLIVIAVAGIVFGPEAGRGEVFELEGVVGPEPAKAIEEWCNERRAARASASPGPRRRRSCLIGATTVFGELQAALDRIWRAPVAGIQRTWGLFRTRLLSFGMILAWLSPDRVAGRQRSVAALGEWWAAVQEGGRNLLQALNVVSSPS